MKYFTAGLARYFKNTSWLFVEKSVRLVINLLVLTYVVRYLGVADFGLLSYAAAFIGLFSSISTMGVHGVLVRELVLKPQLRDELLGSALVLKLLGSVLMLGMIAIASAFMNNSSLINSLIFIMAVSAFFQSSDVVALYFQANVQSRYTVQALLIKTFFGAGIRFGLVWIGASLLWFAWVVLFETAIVAICFIWRYQQVVDLVLKWKFKAKTAIDLTKDSWPMIISGISVAVYMQIDQVMIKHMLGVQSVGVYAVAVKLGEAWNFVPVIICSSLYPAVANARKREFKLYRERLQSLYDLMVLIVTPVAIVMTFYSDTIVGLLFGEEFLSAGPVVSVYVWSSIAVFLGVASSQFLVTENLLKISLYRTLCGALVNITLNVIMIPRYGIMGAAFATLISYFVATFSLAFFKPARSQAILMIKALLFISMFNRIPWKTPK